MERIYVFFILFSIVYFFEAIGSMYIISAIQNIEHQFHMPSKISGIIISANDIGYIPTVILMAYLGSKGNRARWIGLGTLLIALMYFGLASPNFLFPSSPAVPNMEHSKNELVPASELMSPETSITQILEYPIFHDRIPSSIKKGLLEYESNFTNSQQEGPLFEIKNSTLAKNEISFTVDHMLMENIISVSQSVIENGTSSNQLKALMQTFLHNRKNYVDKDLSLIRKAATASFTVCSRLANHVRLAIKETICDESSSNYGPLFVFLVTLFFLGVGRTMPWSLGVPLLDDNIKSKNSPAYFGIASAIRIFGPICGFMIGSFCNKFYYTLHPPPGLTPHDPTWIGAWWIGFIIIGVLTIFPSIAIAFFPNPKLDSTNPEQKKKHLQFEDKHKHARYNDKSNTETFKGFMKDYKQVLKSKVYCGSILGRVVDIFAFKGYMAFLPKYLINHFGIPQFIVYRYMAMFGVAGFALGSLIGGLTVKKFKLSGKKAALLVLIVSFLNSAVFFSKSFISCESVTYKIALDRAEHHHNFSQTCNLECDCESARMYPVCDIKGNAFFSPCHAGCRSTIVNIMDFNNAKFSSCECASGGIVKKEYCHDDCAIPFYVFVFTVIFGGFLAGCTVVPGLLLVLRSVPKSTRSASLGLQGFMISLFGTFPSPFFWGVIIDSACMVWEKSCDGGNGSCTIYDSALLRTRTHITYTIIRLVALLADVYVYMHAGNVKIIDDEEDGEEVSEVVKRGSLRLREFKEL